MKHKTLHMIGNAHIDPVWLWQWPEGFHEVHATFRSALDRMNEYEDFVFVSSSAAFYEWVEMVDPPMFEEIRQRVSEGRWQLQGGMWIQPDCNLPSGESFARQMLYAQRYFQSRFGKTAKVGYNVDSFGHHGMLPQLLRQGGLKYYIFMRPQPHEKGLPSRFFWWESDDGSRVLAFRLPYEYCTWGKGLEDHVLRCAREIKQPYDSTMCFYGVGNHGGGPTQENIDSILRMQGDPEFPNLEFSYPERMFEDLLKKELTIPVVHDEMQHHASGCYSAHSGVKQWNRQAENLLLTAEKFSSIAAWHTGQPYPDFTQAWKNVLFNQFHDILAGTSLEAAYEDARDMYGEARSIANRALVKAVQSIAWKVRIEAGEGTMPLVVFNPHAWSSRVPVEMELGRLPENACLLDEQGRQIPLQTVQSRATAGGRNRISFVADLPSLGYRTYRLVPRSQPTPADETILAGEDFLENARFRLEIDSDSGAIRRLLDKRAGVEVFMGPAALPVVMDDPTDTWAHNVFQFNRPVGSFTARRVALVEHGAVKSVLRVTSEWGRSTLVQDFTLYRDLDKIDVHVTVDWQERFQALKLRFPANLTHMKSTAEIPYGTIERFANGGEEPCQSWIDLSGMSRDNGLPYGLSILNDGKYSFDVNIREIGFTVLRSPIYAHHVPAVPKPDGDYSIIDRGVQRFTYTLLPHTGSWEDAQTPRRAAEMNAPAVSLVETYHPQGELPQCDSFLQVDRGNILVSVLKRAEDGDDLVLRAVETDGEAARAHFNLPRWGRTIQADFRPYEVKSFRIPHDPAQPVMETNFLEFTP